MCSPVSTNSFKGHRFFLLDAKPAAAAALVPQLQEGLADYGFAVESSRQRLAAYHQVENTYLSTFQSLGTLGLILGTVGLATILLPLAIILAPLVHPQFSAPYLHLIRKSAQFPGHVPGLLGF